MLSQIQGLHHVTSLASGAQRNNAFFTRTLGLRRVKKTVNFDRPDVYHLYYGDKIGTPGTVMTYFPFPNATRRTPGSGEVSTTAFSVPKGSLPFWEERLTGRTPSLREGRFGEARLRFDGPDRDDLTLVETEDDRTPWTESALLRKKAGVGSSPKKRKAAGWEGLRALEGKSELRALAPA